MYKGKVLPILITNLFFLALFGVVASFGLMGERWAHLFLASSAVMLPVLLGIALLQAWLNRFSFDDRSGVLVRPAGRGVRYDRVKAVLVTDRGAYVDVFVKQGWLHHTSLVEYAGTERKEELLAELAKRFPDRITKRGRLVSYVPAIVLLVVLAGALAAGHVVLHKRYPGLRAPVRPLERLEQKGRKPRPPVEFVEAFGFTPPAGLRYLGEDKGELYFEDTGRRLRLKVMPGFRRSVFQENETLFWHAMGVRDYHGLMALSYRSRYGLIPLFLKALDLAGLEQAAVYEVGMPVRGFVKQGTRDKEEETHIVLFGDGPEDEIHFFFTGRRRLTEDALRRFISGVVLTGAGTRVSAPFLFPPERG